MLVLSRREGQSILLPELNIEICILKTTGSRVQIGIEAPREIAIQRGELTSAAAVETLKLHCDGAVSPLVTESFAQSDSDVLSVRSATAGYAVLSA
jgi:carbon storage regulator CsrA